MKTIKINRPSGVPNKVSDAGAYLKILEVFQASQEKNNDRISQRMAERILDKLETLIEFEQIEVPAKEEGAEPQVMVQWRVKDVPEEGLSLDLETSEFEKVKASVEAFKPTNQQVRWYNRLCDLLDAAAE